MDDATTVTHVVESSDSLPSLAASYSVSVCALVICPCNDTAVRLTGRASSFVAGADGRSAPVERPPLQRPQRRPGACASVCERVRACASVCERVRAVVWSLSLALSPLNAPTHRIACRAVVDHPQASRVRCQCASALARSLARPTLTFCLFSMLAEGPGSTAAPAAPAPAPAPAAVAEPASEFVLPQLRGSGSRSGGPSPTSSLEYGGASSSGSAAPSVASPRGLSAPHDSLASAKAALLLHASTWCSAAAPSLQRCSLALVLVRPLSPSLALIDRSSVRASLCLSVCLSASPQ